MECSGTTTVRGPGPAAPHRHLALARGRFPEDPLLALHTAGGLLLLTMPLPDLGTGHQRFSTLCGPALFLREDRIFLSGDRGLVSFSVFVPSVTPVADSGSGRSGKLRQGLFPGPVKTTPEHSFPAVSAAGTATPPPYPPAQPAPPRGGSRPFPGTRNPFSQCSGRSSQHRTGGFDGPVNLWW